MSRLTSLFLSLVAVAAVPLQAQTAQPWTTGTYVYDGAGNIKSIGADQYRYDALSRVVTGTTGGRSQSATYDGWGNVRTLTTDGTALTFGVNGATNRITEQIDPVTGQPYNVFGTYDAAGRLQSMAGIGHSFSYDANDTVVRSTVDGITEVHLYTAADERIASVTVANGAETRSDWTLRDFQGKVLRRLEKTGAQWTWKEDYIYRGAGLLAAEVDTIAQTLHFFPDHLGSPRLITGNGGMKVALHTYHPFGGETTLANQDNEKLKFTGHEQDAASLYYMHARYYAVNWGRFLTVDPTRGSAKMQLSQTWNRYSYVLNNPLTYNDPDGRETNPVTGKSYIYNHQILNSKSNPRKGHYGYVRDGGKKWHSGNDLAAPRGTPIFAPISGTASVGYSKEGGHWLRITKVENGHTIAVHMSHLNRPPNVKSGEKVLEGQPNVAEVGNTGNAKDEPPHVHTSVYVDGNDKIKDTENPQEWFRKNPSDNEWEREQQKKKEKGTCPTTEGCTGPVRR